MPLRKIKTPVECCFIMWMNNFPDSPHWNDKERFFQFVKTVCRYNAKKWKNIDFLKTRILEHSPHFDPEMLNLRLNLFTELVEFYNVRPMTGSFEITDKTVKEGHYIEVECRNGKRIEREKPLKKAAP